MRECDDESATRREELRAARVAAREREAHGRHGSDDHESEPE